MLPLLPGFYELFPGCHRESAAAIQQAGSHTPGAIYHQPRQLPLDDGWLLPPTPEYVNSNSLADHGKINKTQQTKQRTCSTFFPMIM